MKASLIIAIISILSSTAFSQMHYYDIKFDKFQKGPSINEGPLSKVIQMRKRFFKDHIIFTGSKIDEYSKSNSENRILYIPYELYIPKNYDFNGKITKRIKRKALVYPNPYDYPRYISPSSMKDTIFIGEIDLLSFKKDTDCEKYCIKKNIPDCYSINKNKLKKANIGRVGCSPGNIRYSQNLINSENSDTILVLKSNNYYFIPFPSAMHYDNDEKIKDSRTIYFSTKSHKQVKEVLSLQRKNNFTGRIEINCCPYIKMDDKDFIVTNYLKMIYEKD